LAEPANGQTRRSTTAPKPKIQIETLVLGALFVALLGTFILYRDSIWSIVSDPDHLKSWIATAGPLGPISIIALQIIQIVIAPIPGQAISMAAGYAYGFWSGSLLTIIGGAIGASFAILIGRYCGRPLTTRVAGPSVIEFVGRFDRIKSPFIWALVFALPIGDPICYAAGLTSVALPRLLLAAVIGRLPAQIIAIFLGTSVGEYGMVAVEAGLIAGGIFATIGWLTADRFREKVLAYARVDDEQPVLPPVEL
jgi:uncharacterized membrane protein YdjX (TVP38/TMEM64 family)